ncbi:MAG: hypothetical protein LBT38_09550, partial [Deltaproteobacteria bacterium]|nr:hypothetical protein [Deltaproteobacteria bacterium]
MREIDIFKLVDFNSVVSSNHIWSDNLIDVPDIHANEREIFSFHLDSLINNQEPAYAPKGFLFTGDGGSGKTHLLSTFRRMAQEKGVFFLYTDMMTANNFWRQLTSNALESLSLAKMNNGRTQAVQLLDQIMTAAGYHNEYVETLVMESYKELDKIIPKIIKLLGQRYPAANRWAHILRAFFFFASEEPLLSTVGQDWLLGELTFEDPKKYKLPVKGPTTHDETIMGLTWLMSLNLGSSILVIDQLDNIFKQYLHDNPDPQAAVNNFCDGLASLINKNHRCLTVVSCIFSTWTKLKTHASLPAQDRLGFKFDLPVFSDQTSRRLLVASRLKPAFVKAQFTPPNPIWPFWPEFFAENSERTPRKLLDKCSDFQQQCLLADRILPPKIKIEAPTPELYKELKQLYNQSYNDTNVAKWWEKTAEDAIWPEALWAFAMCFCYENNDKLPLDVDLTVKASSLPPGKKIELLPLHALLHYEFTKGEEEDRFLGVRALLQKDPGAFKRRLIRAKEELTINPNSQLRQLIMVRFDKAESFTATTKALVDEFNKLGGQWV